MRGVAVLAVHVAEKLAASAANVAFGAAESSPSLQPVISLFPEIIVSACVLVNRGVEHQALDFLQSLVNLFLLFVSRHKFLSLTVPCSEIFSPESRFADFGVLGRASYRDR
jgi:hypothetical protein